MSDEISSVRLKEAKRRVLAEGDREVWVVERNPGSGWRVSAVFESYGGADQYRKDLRRVMNNYPKHFPENFKSDTDVRIRSGSRKSGTKLYGSYPPECDHDE